MEKGRARQARMERCERVFEDDGEERSFSLSSKFASSQFPNALYLPRRRTHRSRDGVDCPHFDPFSRLFRFPSDPFRHLFPRDPYIDPSLFLPRRPLHDPPSGIRLLFAGSRHLCLAGEIRARTRKDESTSLRAESNEAVQVDSEIRTKLGQSRFRDEGDCRTAVTFDREARSRRG